MPPSSPPLQELITPLTPEQVRSTYYRIFAKIGINVTSWKVGNPIRTMVAAVSTWQSSFTYWASNAIRAKFLRLSKGDWLTSVAHFDYGTDRNSATFAEGPVMVRNTSANVYDFDPGDLAIVYETLSSDGFTFVRHRYTNTAAVHIGAGTEVAPSEHPNVVVVAEEQGDDWSIPPGATIVLDPDYDGLTAEVVTAINGTNEESDEELVLRAEDAASALSPNGPWDAYRYVATSYRVNGAPLCTKVQVVPATATTRMLVYVGNASGGLTGPELDQIELELQTKVVPLGVTINTISAVPKYIRVQYNLYCRANSPLSNDTIVHEVKQAIDKYFAEFPIGGEPAIPANEPSDLNRYPLGSHWMYRSKLRAVIMGALDNVPGVDNPVFHAVVSTTKDSNDAGDIGFAPGELAVHYLEPIASVWRV